MNLAQLEIVLLENEVLSAENQVLRAAAGDVQEETELELEVLYAVLSALVDECNELRRGR
jgi:hypothetical protein